MDFVNELCATRRQTHEMRTSRTQMFFYSNRNSKKFKITAQWQNNEAIEKMTMFFVVVG